VRLFAVFLTVLGLANCTGPALVEYPLSVPGAVEIDARILGAWSYTESIEEPLERGLLAARLSSADRHRLDIEVYVALLSLKEDAPPTSSRFAAYVLRASAYPTVLGGAVFYNLQIRQVSTFDKQNDDSPPVLNDPGLGAMLAAEGYRIARFESLGDGRLTIRLLSEKALDESKIPKKTADCGKDCTYSYYDILPDALARLVTASAANDAHWLNFDFARMQ
jgi:hypothetical protein